MRRILLAAVAATVLVALAPAVQAQTGNVDPNERHAWAENAGWLDFRPSFGGVTVLPTYLTGYAWHEGTGWVKLGSNGGGPYANTTATDWGVNLNAGTGALSGYAWSENAGWIRMDPAFGGVTYDDLTKKLSGWAWSEGYGWIHFRSTTPTVYGVAVTCGALTGTVSGGGTVCVGSSSTVTVTVSGGAAPYTVTLDNGGGTQSGTGPVFDFTVSPSSTTTYSVVSLADALSCAASGGGSATVTVNATPAAPVVDAPTLACASSPNNWAEVPDAGAGATYGWQISNGTITSGDGTRRIVFTAGPTGKVGLSVTVTAAGGCPSAEATAEVDVRSLCLDAIPSPVVVGAPNTFTGSGFSPGSVIKLFVSAASGPVDTNPAGWTPTSWTPTSLTWDIPPNVPLGQGFGSLMIVNTDQGYAASNVEGQLLYGDAADGLPTILSINGVGLSPYDPSIPGAHVESVLAAASTVTITGTGFSGPLVNVYTATGNVGPLTPLPGGTDSEFQVVIPADVPAGPGTFQVVNSGAGWTLSNAVAAVLRARIVVTSVEVVGGTVTVTGDGFCALTVVNLFNVQGGGVVNLGGLHPDGTPLIPLTVLDAQHFTFTLPAGAEAGPAYVMALNPPFTPFTSSGTDPGGAFTIP